MKKRKMRAHINNGLAQLQKYDYRALQKQPIFIEYVKYMREALGTKRKQRYKMFLYREKKSELNV